MTIRTNQTNSHGSVLLITLLTAWVIGIALVSYLTLVANQNRSTYHSLSWNSCVPVMEAGVEEALTQLYYNDITQLGNNQWTYSDGLYHKTSYLGDDGSKYHVTIKPTDPPVIVSTGYYPAPGNTGTPMGGQTAFGMMLGAVTPALISRTLQVTTKRLRPGDGGIQAKGRINLSGTSWLDSFDSTNPQESTNGKYDPAKRSANGLALSNSTAPDAVHVGDGHVYGRVTSGPGPLDGLDATVTYVGGAVGDTAWNLSNSGIEDGYASNDANVQFNDVAAPFSWGSGTTPVAALGADGTNYNWVVGPGNNQLASVNIGVGKKMLVTGDATLYVSGDFYTTGTGGTAGYVYLAPGASLKLYIGGNGSVSGTGIINGSGYAKNFSVFGLPTCTALSYGGSSEFIGTVYAPSANFSFSGKAGGYGSFTANTVTVSGGAHIAYDKGLNAGGRYVANSWNEI